jgi:hypothetical protein
MIVTFADIPNPSVTEIGTVILCLAVILVIVERCIVVFKHLVGKDMGVTHTDLSNIRRGLADCVTRGELHRLEQWLTALTTDHKKMIEYQHIQYSEMNKLVSDLRVGIERMHREMKDEVHTMFLQIMSRMDNKDKNQLAAIVTTGKE